MPEAAPARGRLMRAPRHKPRGPLLHSNPRHSAALRASFAPFNVFRGAGNNQGTNGDTNNQGGPAQQKARPPPPPPPRIETAEYLLLLRALPDLPEDSARDGARGLLDLFDDELPIICGAAGSVVLCERQREVKQQLGPRGVTHAVHFRFLSRYARPHLRRLFPSENDPPSLQGKGALSRHDVRG